jgi:hypothetical protein
MGHKIFPPNYCGKKLFSSQKSAENKLRVIQNDRKSERKPIRAYYCSKCNGWHLTHKPKMGEGPAQVPLESYNPRWENLLKKD